MLSVALFIHEKYSHSDSKQNDILMINFLLLNFLHKNLVIISIVLTIINWNYSKLTFSYTVVSIDAISLRDIKGPLSRIGWKFLCISANLAYFWFEFAHFLSNAMAPFPLTQGFNCVLPQA